MLGLNEKSKEEYNNYLIEIKYREFLFPEEQISNSKLKEFADILISKYEQEIPPGAVEKQFPLLYYLNQKSRILERAVMKLYELLDAEETQRNLEFWSDFPDGCSKYRNKIDNGWIPTKPGASGLEEFSEPLHLIDINNSILLAKKFHSYYEKSNISQEDKAKHLIRYQPSKINLKGPLIDVIFELITYYREDFRSKIVLMQHGTINISYEDSEDEDGCTSKNVVYRLLKQDYMIKDSSKVFDLIIERILYPLTCNNDNYKEAFIQFVSSKDILNYIT